MLRTVRDSFLMLVLLTLVTGIAYPLLITLVGSAFFPHRAEGSLIFQEHRLVGSELIGQPFSEPRYFWGRPSATSPTPYNAAASSGSNQGPLNPALIDAVKSRVAALLAADPANPRPVPLDLVTASASGLDPHISPAAADWQADRVARARGLDPERVRRLIAETTEGRQLGVLGEPRVNVLRLNLALDRIMR